jgi:pimeloyl-ACP methyl ester carboxylesterase
VPPQVPLGTEIATEAQRAVDSIFARCAEDDACSERFPTLAGDFAALRERLENDPIIVELQNPVTSRLESIDFGSAQFSAAVRLLAYHQASIAVLPLMINEAAEGNFIPLAAQFQLTMAELSDSLALGMHNSVMCAEDAPRYESFDIDEHALLASYIGPLQLEAIEAICSIWPQGPVDEGFHEPLVTDIPVLLLSGDADPITPPRYAELAAERLTNARHLVGREQGHGQAIVGCTPRIVADFISEPTPSDLDVDCMDRSFAMPFFLDFSGPRP